MAKHVNIEVELVRQTILALICRVPTTSIGWREVVVPKVLIHDPDGGIGCLEDMVPVAETAHLIGGDYPSVTLELPEWFAIQEELI